MIFLKLLSLFSLLATFIYPFAPVAQTIPDSRFGVIESYDDPASASAIGAGWTRVRFAWSDLQPNNDGEWNNAFFSDEQLAVELASGRQVVGLIVNTPFWALEDSSVPGVPRGLYTPEREPNNVWANFVRQIVTRYAGRIDHWIIWNEPDIWDPAYPGRTWGGSVEQFFQLQRVAYVTAKDVNPNSVIHLSAFTYFWDVNYGRTPFFSLLMDEIQRDPSAASNNFYFDVASANLYFDSDNIYDLIAWHRGQMFSHGIDKPIWLTETNAAPSSDPTWLVANPTFPISLDEQAAFIPQAFAMALAGGASRVGVYKMIDTPGDRAANPEPFGLVRDDGSRRPAFTAYRVAANYLSGFTAATLEHRDDFYAQVNVQRGDARTIVLWTRQHSPVQVSVPAQSTQALLVDAFGNQRTITPSDGAYTVEIPGCTQPFCAIGGAPRLIVEGAPSIQIDPIAPAAPVTQPTSNATSDETIEAITIAPTPVPSDSPTQTQTPTPTLTLSPTPSATATSTPITPTTPTLTFTHTPVALTDPALTQIEQTSNADGVILAGSVMLAILLIAYMLARTTTRHV